jgi:vancomycin permeability regulator SanA
MVNSGKKQWFFGGALFIAALIVAVIVGSYIVVQRYHRYVIDSPQAISTALKTDRVSAIVLGSGIGADGIPGAALTQRLESAIELYKQGAINQIIVSGYNPSEYYNEPQAMENYLREVGIPLSDITQDNGGYDTYATCQGAAKSFTNRPVVMVSQPGHLDRAIFLCRSLDVQAYGYAASVSPNTQNTGYQSIREVAANVKAVLDVLVQKVL